MTFYLVKSHPDLSMLVKPEAVTEVEVCDVCGCVFVDIHHRPSQCPVGHDQIS